MLNKKHADQLQIDAYNLFFQNPENSNQKVFPGLIKHYIINLEFLNSPFCWAKFLTRAPCNRNSMHLTFFYVSAILNFVFAIRSSTYKLLQRVPFILFSISIDKNDSLNNVQTTLP